MLFKLTRSLCCHQKAAGIVLIFTRSFSLLFAHENFLFDWISSCSVCGFHHARSEDNSMSISFPQNASQSCCWTLLDHFIVMKRQRGSFRSSRGIFRNFSHMRICCLIGVQHARCEEVSVSISFLQNASQSCCSSLLDHFVVFKRQRQSS